MNHANKCGELLNERKWTTKSPPKRQKKSVTVSKF